MHRRDEFRASKIMLERARAQENIELLTPYAVKEFVRRRERRARARRARSTPRPARSATLPVSGAFIAIGHEPQSELVRRARSTSTRTATWSTEGRSTRTNRPGVFAAGDLVDHTYRQAITAAGSGCQAALDAEWYLRDTPEVPTPGGHARWAIWPRRSGRPSRLSALSVEAALELAADSACAPARRRSRRARRRCAARGARG